MKSCPAPSTLARAVAQGLTGAPPAGFSLLEVMLVAGGLALLSGAGYRIYQSSATAADVRIEQANLQAIASTAAKVHGVTGSYAGLTTSQAIAQRIVPSSMVAGAGLVSRFGEPVLLEPASAPSCTGPKPAAALQVTYEAVPARACASFVQAGSEGMLDVAVAGASVFTHRPPDLGCMAAPQPVRLDVPAAITACRNGAPVAFTYSSGATGLVAQVLDPVRLDPLNPPTPPPPPPPPVTPPPPAAPGCGAAPGPATGTPPAGQVCSYSWISAPVPTCWTVLPVCTPVAPPPSVPPPSTPPPAPPPAPPPPGSPPVCSPPASFTETGNQTGTCPAGQSTPTGSPTFPQTRSRQVSFACPDPFDAPVRINAAWTSWTPPASTACRPICNAPPTATTPESQTASCGANRVTPSGATSFTQTRVRTNTYTCPAPTGPYTSNPATYTPWTPTEASACAPRCIAPPPLNETRAGTPQTRTLNEDQAGSPQSTPGTNNARTLDCVAGQYGRVNQVQSTTIVRSTTQVRSTPQTRSTQQHRTTTYACPSPTGSATATVGAWSAPGATYGTWTPPPGPWSAPGAPYGAWSPPGAPLGAWTTTSNTCTSCAAPPQTDWEARSAPCPTGTSGSHTWEELRQRTVGYACPAGTRTLPPATYGSWSWTGSRRNEVNSCTPTNPPGAVCPTRNLQMGCAVFDQYTRVRESPIEYSDPGGRGGAMGVGFDNGQYVECHLGYEDTRDAEGFPAPLSGGDTQLFIYTRGGTDWESYSQQEDSSAYVSVYNRNADRTRGSDRCWGETKVSFNWEGR